jgi:hypothetical protein
MVQLYLSWTIDICVMVGMWHTQGRPRKAAPYNDFK